LHTELALTRALTLIAGMRQSHESKTYLYVENDIPGTPSNVFPGGFDYPARTGYDHFDYRVGLRYHLTPDFMTYADVATGFRGGGFNPRPATPAQALGYGPERLVSYELGARNEFLDHRLRFNNTAYFSHYSDIQLTADLVDVGTGFPDAVVTNAATADIYGFESELRADPLDGLSLEAGGSYTHFRYTNLGLAAGLADGPTLDSDQVYTPTWKLNGGAELVLPLARRYGKLTFASDFSWRSLQYADAANSPQMAISAYGVLNARLTLATPSGWTVALGGTNITNEFYYSAKNFISGNYQWKGVPSLPAQWYLSVRRSF
jgi:iron complex outermembrane receptor protein